MSSAIDPDVVKELRARLVAAFGGVNELGRAYAVRYGEGHRAVERMLARTRAGRVKDMDEFDRLACLYGVNPNALWPGFSERAA